MEYRQWKAVKRQIIAAISLSAGISLFCVSCTFYWAKLKLPEHQYKPKLGDWMGPSNLTYLHLGLFTTSQGSYYSLFKNPDPSEMRKLEVAASLTLLSVCAAFIAGSLKVLAQRYCHVAKRYKVSAILNVLAVLLNVGSLVLWFWFIHGFTHGRFTLGARTEYSACVYVMLSCCLVLIVAIGLDFIRCKHSPHRRLDTLSPAPSEASDVAPLDLVIEPAEHPPPPYQQIA